MVGIIVSCPACFKKGKIEVDEEVIKKSSRGITAITVEKGFICEDRFIVYIDKNLTVRDCFLSDFEIEIPQVNLTSEIEIELSRKDFDLELIHININTLTLAYIIRGCLNKKKVVYINDFNIIHDHLIKFLGFIFKDSYEFNLIGFTKSVYREMKKKFKDHIVLSNEKIIRDKDKILDQSVEKMESALLHKLIMEKDPDESLILLRNEILKTFKFCSEIILKTEKGKSLTQKLIVDYISKQDNIKMPKQYINFLKMIIKNYFEKTIKKISDVETFVEFI